MKITSFVHDGQFDCGLVDGQGHIYRLDGCEAVRAISPSQRLPALLAMDRDERRQVVKQFEFTAESKIHPRVLAPAVPLCPLFFYGHGNSPTIWRRQQGPRFRWNIPRMTHFRVRPWTSLSGNGDTVELPVKASLAHGAEFAVVLGKDAYRVPETEAESYIAGVLVMNDLFMSGLHGDYDNLPDEELSRYMVMSLDCMSKSADGNGAIGPWITTVEELEDAYTARMGTQRLSAMRKSSYASAYLYDLIIQTSIDGKLSERGHTSATLLGAEYLIAYFSQFMTLPAGTILGLGAPSWDGQMVDIPEQLGSRSKLEVSIEQVGDLQTHIERVGCHRERKRSPFLARVQRWGMDENKTKKSPSRSVWICRGNYLKADEIEGVPESNRYCANLYPPGVLGKPGAPLVLAPHMGAVECEVHLAGVIGRPCYNIEEGEALECLAGVTVMLHLRDRSLGHRIKTPTDYETRGVHYLGGCADGFARLSPVVPLTHADDLDSLVMSVSIQDGDMVQTHSGGYRNGLNGMIAMCTRQITLLPDDVLSLGRSGSPLVLAENTYVDGKVLHAEIENLGRIDCTLKDHRNPEAQHGNTHGLYPELE